MRIDETELPYYKPDSLRRWSEKNGAKRVHDVAISYDKPPPPMEFGPASERSSSEKGVHVPPFDLQEIPRVMRPLGMPVSAKLMERWFAGALNYSPTENDEKILVNQDGKPYPPSMFDTTTIKMEWVLQFERAKAAYDRLLSWPKLLAPASLDILKGKLSRLGTSFQDIYVTDLCKNDLREIHRRFQFQYEGVESTFSQQFKQYIHRQYAHRGIPDDLTGALGSFNFYVAPFHILIDFNVAEIDSVIVYIKDNYTFTDKAGEVSQYLGHWGARGIVIIPLNKILSLTNTDATPVGDFYADSAIAVDDPSARGGVYYPVWNKTFREWQRHHHRGGDFVIFSDFKAVKLSKPIRIALG